INFVATTNAKNYELKGAITVNLTSKEVAELSVPAGYTSPYGTPIEPEVKAQVGASTDVTSMIKSKIVTEFYDEEGNDVTAAAKAGTLDADTYTLHVEIVDSNTYYGVLDEEYTVSKVVPTENDFKLDTETAVVGGTEPKAVFQGTEKGLSLGEKATLELTYKKADAAAGSAATTFDKITGLTEATKYDVYVKIKDATNYSNQQIATKIGTVTISPMSKVESVEALDAVDAENGVSKADLIKGLPAQAKLVMTDSEITGVTADIEWSEDFTYDAASTKAQTVTVKGTLTNADVNWGDVKKEISITVNVAAQILAVKGIAAPQAISVDNGTTKEDIASKLPAKVTLTMADGITGTYEAAVKWSDFEYDATKTDAQTLTIKGTVEKSDELVWGDDVSNETTITVNVAAKPEEPKDDEQDPKDSEEQKPEEQKPEDQGDKEPIEEEPAAVNDNITSIDTKKATAMVKDVVEGKPVEVALAVVVEGAVYRMYNPNTGEHFYTKSEAERDYLKSAGWNYEANACFAAVAADEKGAEPVYRVYNENTGMHHYTMSYGEAIILKNLGWSYEGISFYAFSKDSGVGSPQYRLYNPNNGTHHWTVDFNEKESLVKAGWNDEKIAWNVK
ncbi:MAG: hypothetical protein IJ711_02300, partial [Lachnospiraceae bacterium]|nr:hypothetical protein [Lachnospiraceae bacterium]